MATNPVVFEAWAVIDHNGRLVRRTFADDLLVAEYVRLARETYEVDFTAVRVRVTVEVIEDGE